MAIEQSTDEIMDECVAEESDFMDDWVQYTFETYGHDSPEYKAAKIKEPIQGNSE